MSFRDNFIKKAQAYRAPFMFKESYRTVRKEDVVEEEVWMGTSVRKKGMDGKWYLIPVLQYVILHDLIKDKEKAVSDLFQRFFFSTTECMLFHRMPDTIEEQEDWIRMGMIALDPDQEEQVPYYQTLNNYKNDKD